jgi:hypothetical protein
MVVKLEGLYESKLLSLGIFLSSDIGEIKSEDFEKVTFLKFSEFLAVINLKTGAFVISRVGVDKITKIWKFKSSLWISVNSKSFQVTSKIIPIESEPWDYESSTLWARINTSIITQAKHQNSWITYSGIGELSVPGLWLEVKETELNESTWISEYKGEWCYWVKIEKEDVQKPKA